MPDLGKYAAEVGIAYGASIVLITALIIFCLIRSRRTLRALRALEQRTSPRG